MPFTLFRKPTPHLAGRPAATEPRVTMRRNDKGATVVGINKPMLDELKWILGDRIEVMVGTGNDEGTIAIRRAKTGYKLSKDGSATRAKFAITHLFPGEPVPSTESQYAVSGDTLYIAVPEALLVRHQTPASKRFHINSMATVAA